MRTRETLLRCDAQELRMTADMADVHRRDLSRAVIDAIVALVQHEKRTLAEVREMALRIEQSSALKKEAA